MNEQKTQETGRTWRVLPPLTGDSDDLKVLEGDRRSLEGVVAAIMANKRLASLIALAYMEEQGMLMAPVTWFEEMRQMEKAIKQLLH